MLLNMFGDMLSAQSADAVRKDATLSSTQQNFILNLSSCLVSMLQNLLLSTVVNQPFYFHYFCTGQPVLAGTPLPPVQNWRVL